MQKRALGTFALAMITVAAIVSLRNLPLTAMLGLPAVFFLVVATVVFFIPIALVTAELAAAWPKPGGNYIWVSEAFGKPWGFFALWMSWMESITWFPAILVFTAAMVAHFIQPIIPGLWDNNTFLLFTMLFVFWAATFINFLGIEVSSWVSSLGVLLGTLIPGILIVGLGLWWIFSGQTTAVDLTWQSLIPSCNSNDIALFGGVLLGLAGVELAVFHIREAQDPQKNYLSAVILASLLILIIYILGTLSIVVIVPKIDISFAFGIIQAIEIFFKKFGLFCLVPLIAFFLLAGSLAGINAWIIGPAKGMLVVAQDGFLPKWLRNTNKNAVPVALLLLQVIIGSFLSMFQLYFKNSNATIWILTALSAQFTFVQYFLVFIAAIKLRYSQKNTLRPYRVPFIWIVSIIGIVSCIFTFFIVYIPPIEVNIGNTEFYCCLLVTIFIILSIPPILFVKLRHKFD